MLPMALVILRTRGLLPTALASGASVASLWVVNRLQVANGKVAASLAWVTQGGFNYGDAFGVAPTMSGGEWVDALGANLARNLHLLGLHFAKRPGELMPWCLGAMLVVTALVLVLGVVRARRDALPLGAALLLLLVFGLSVTLYDVKLHKMMRTAMFAYPLAVAALAGALLPRERRVSRGALLLGAPLALALGAGGFVVTKLGAERLTESDAQTAQATRSLALLNADGKLIVSSTDAAQYAVEHYPVRVSQPPANEPTLALLLSKYDVGVIRTPRTLSEDFLRRHGLTSVTLADGNQFYMPAADVPALERRLTGRQRPGGRGR